MVEQWEILAIEYGTRERKVKDDRRKANVSIKENSGRGADIVTERE